MGFETEKKLEDFRLRKQIEADKNTCQLLLKHNKNFTWLYLSFLKNNRFEIRFDMRIANSDKILYKVFWQVASPKNSWQEDLQQHSIIGYQLIEKTRKQIEEKTCEWIGEGQNFLIFKNSTVASAVESATVIAVEKRTAASNHTQLHSCLSVITLLIARRLNQGVFSIF